jgi:sugar lactone lactonase YvrE
MTWRALLLCMLMLSVAGCEREDADASSVRTVFGGAGLGPGEFSYPRAMALSPVDGCAFIVDKTARVQRFSADGEYQTQWSMPESADGKPTGVYVDAKGLVWVADTHYARVIVYDRDGHEQYRFGSRGEGPGQFIFPTNVVIDREGVIYVGEYGENSRISRFRKVETSKSQKGRTPLVDYLDSFADKKSGDGWVERPQAMAIDQEGILWVADACRHRICRYDRRSGKLLSAFGSAGSELNNFNFPYGMALEPRGTLIVADRCNNRLVRYDRSGKPLASWGSQGRATGQLQQPWSVAVGKDDRVYCLDSWNNRVQVLNW